MNAGGSTIWTRIRRRFSPMELSATASSTRTGGSTCSPAWRRSAPTHPAGLEHEILVLDNASDDGSAEAVERWIACRRRSGRAPAADRARAPRGQGRRTTPCCCARRAASFCLLLNEDSELRPGAVRGAARGAARRPGAAAAGAQLLDPDGQPQPCAWRLPGLGTALAQALFLHRCWSPQSGGERTARGRLGAVGGDAGAPRGRRGGRLPRPRLLRLLRRDRLLQAPARRRLARSSTSPPPRAIHHEQLATDRSRRAAAVVEFHRGRDRYMRKHHGARRSPARPGALPRGATSRARSPPLVLPATTPAGTGCTPARRFARSAARACARPPRPTTAAHQRAVHRASGHRPSLGRPSAALERHRPPTCGPRRGDAPRRPRPSRRAAGSSSALAGARLARQRPQPLADRGRAEHRRAAAPAPRG